MVYKFTIKLQLRITSTLKMLWDFIYRLKPKNHLAEPKEYCSVAFILKVTF